jgi:hypothetical protein
MLWKKSMITTISFYNRARLVLLKTTNIIGFQQFFYGHLLVSRNVLFQNPLPKIFAWFMEAVCPGSFPANNLFSYQASPEKFGTAQPSPLALNPLAPLTSVIPMPAELHAGLRNSANFIKI